MLDALHTEAPQWVRFHDPEHSGDGYALALYQRRIPFLMDMNGRVVHTWPGVRATARARLLPEGHLAVLSSSGSFEEYDWEGRKVWSFEPRSNAEMLHHDFARLNNGHYLLPVLHRVQRADFLLEVDREGREVWRWSSWKAIPEDLVDAPPGDRTHLNSVQELPPNRWHDAGHTAFRPGNILVSIRNLNAIYVIDRTSGDVTWKYDHDLDLQHEARMLPPGMPGAGNIQLFNNGYHRAQRSSVLELDPVERSVVWSYEHPGFFSATTGAQQALPNGNVLITSSRGGRAFEVTREGRVVWQWVPPWQPLRLTRYPADFCPQLERLTLPPKRAVSREDPEDYLDPDLYAYTLTHGTRRLETGSRRIRVLRRPRGCRQLRLPDDPMLRVTFGADRRGRCESGTDAEARFSVSIRPLGSSSSEEVMARAVTPESLGPFDPEDRVTLVSETVSLSRFSGQTVEMCLGLDSFDTRPPAPCFVWTAPKIRPSLHRPAELVDLDEGPEVEKHQREQLEALGYVQ